MGGDGGGGGGGAGRRHGRARAAARGPSPLPWASGASRRCGGPSGTATDPSGVEEVDWREDLVEEVEVVVEMDKGNGGPLPSWP